MGTGKLYQRSQAGFEHRLDEAIQRPDLHKDLYSLSVLPGREVPGPEKQQPGVKSRKVRKNKVDLRLNGVGNRNTIQHVCGFLFGKLEHDGCYSGNIATTRAELSHSLYFCRKYQGRPRPRKKKNHSSIFFHVFQPGDLSLSPDCSAKQCQQVLPSPRAPVPLVLPSLSSCSPCPLFPIAIIKQQRTKNQESALHIPIIVLKAQQRAIPWPRAPKLFPNPWRRKKAVPKNTCHFSSNTFSLFQQHLFPHPKHVTFPATPFPTPSIHCFSHAQGPGIHCIEGHAKTHKRKLVRSTFAGAHLAGGAEVAVLLGTGGLLEDEACELRGNLWVFHVHESR